MGNNIDPFGNESDNDSDLVKNLRKANKEKEKELKELQARIEQLEKSTRSGDIASVLAGFGLDPRVAKFYPADQPTTADAVAAWVKENGELFGSARPQQPQTNTLSEDAQRGLEAYRQLHAADEAVTMDLGDRLKQAKTQEELMAVLSQFQVPIGMR